MEYLNSDANSFMRGKVENVPRDRSLIETV
jgi:hypothetical protein